MLLEAVSVSVQSVGKSKSSLNKTPPTPGRSSGVGDGTTVGSTVGVSVGGNQTIVGVRVCVTVGVAEGNGVSVELGKHAGNNTTLNSRRSFFINVGTLNVERSTFNV